MIKFCFDCQMIQTQNCDDYCHPFIWIEGEEE